MLLEFVLQSKSIMDKAIEIKVDTGMEIVKCIGLLHNIIIDIEGLRDFSSNDCGSLGANGRYSVQKNAECVTLLPLLPKKSETYSVDFSTVQLVLYRGKKKLLETCSNSKSSLHYVVT